MAVDVAVAVAVAVGVAVAVALGLAVAVAVAVGVGVGVPHAVASFRFAAVTVPVSTDAASRTVSVHTPLICPVVRPPKVAFSDVTGAGSVCPAAPACVVR